MKVDDISKAVEDYRLHGVYFTRASRVLTFYDESLSGVLRVTAIDQLFLCKNGLTSSDLIEHPNETGAPIEIIGGHLATILERPSDAVLDLILKSGERIRLVGRGPGEYYRIHLEKSGKTEVLILG